MPRHTAAVVAFAALFCSAAAPARAQCPYDLSAVDAAVSEFTASVTQVRDISIRVQRGPLVLYERTFGNFTIDSVVPIASASKWPAGAVIMSLVDDGIVTLDQSLATYLPAYQQPGLDQITFRQAFAHTSGLPGNSGKGFDDCSACLNDRFTTLQSCAALIAAGGLRTDAQGNPVPPGSDFAYGGCSMQAAGAAAEIASGLSWVTLVQERLRTPLGLSTFSYGPGLNPRVAGGLSSNLRDYSRFLQMLSQGGVIDGVTVFSPAAVAALLNDQTNDVPVTYTPTLAQDFAGYGVGCWVNVESVIQTPLVISSEGAFGFSPWLDRRRTTTGVVMVLDSNQRVRPLVEAVQAAVRRAVDTTPDVNASGVVDFADITAALANFGRPSLVGQPTGPGPIGDANASGAVDFGDITLILARFGEACL